MSTQPASRLTIVEVPHPVARRAMRQTSATNRGSSNKRTRPASEGKSAKKRTAVKKNVLSSKAKAKTRLSKSSTAVQNKSVRRQPTKMQSQAEMAIERVLPIEIDIPFCEAQQLEPQSGLAVEELSSAMGPSFAEITVAQEECTIENIGNNVHAELQPSPLEGASTEMEVIAEVQPILAAETTMPTESPMQSVALAEPQSIRGTFAFQWNAFLQVVAKGWNWLQQRLKTQQSKKRLRVCESVSLGEKRFIAVVQVDGEQFLVGGSSSSVSTLAHLEQPREFADVFRRYGQSGMQA